MARQRSCAVPRALVLALTAAAVGAAVVGMDAPVLAGAAVVGTDAPVLAGPTAVDKVREAQWCVNRWNQMRMGWPPTIALVSTTVPCRLELAYSSQGHCSEANTVPQSPHWCVDRQNGFPCRLNLFGAYRCATHAVPTRVTKWNATLTSARGIALNRPPASRVRTPAPAWTLKYPYLDGYIHPWTGSGALRPGLLLSGDVRASCSPTSERTRAPAALRCLGSRNRLYDPCFPNPGQPRLLACAIAPGSTRFARLHKN